VALNLEKQASSEHDVVLGHLALHYRPGDERAARRLLELLGGRLVDNGPSPGTDGFCTVVVGEEDANYADNIMFLSAMTPEQAALEETIGASLQTDRRDEVPVVQRFRDSIAEKPESISHIGIRYQSLERVERIVAALEAAAAPGAELEGRISVVKYRPRPGGTSEADDALVADRISSSPVFDGTEPSSFAPHWIQIFVSTDLCGFGILAFGNLFELDYVFDPFFQEPPTFGRPVPGTERVVAVTSSP
jgi:hypothetical protein